MLLFAMYQYYDKWEEGVDVDEEGLISTGSMKLLNYFCKFKERLLRQLVSRIIDTK